MQGTYRRCDRPHVCGVQMIVKTKKKKREKTTRSSYDVSFWRDVKREKRKARLGPSSSARLSGGGRRRFATGHRWMCKLCASCHQCYLGYFRLGHARGVAVWRPFACFGRSVCFVCFVCFACFGWVLRGLRCFVCTLRAHSGFWDRLLPWGKITPRCARNYPIPGHFSPQP